MALVIEPLLHRSLIQPRTSTCLNFEEMHGLRWFTQKCKSGSYEHANQQGNYCLGERILVRGLCRQVTLRPPGLTHQLASLALRYTESILQHPDRLAASLGA
jgi:hypothetical protein